MNISWLLYLIPAGTFGAGAYLGSYLKKKGENLATHEDIQKLVDQVRAVTTATKEIETKLSSDVWDQQKRWELKRDALFEVTKKMGLAMNSLVSLHAAYQKATHDMSPQERDVGGTRQREWNATIDELDRAILVAELVCQPELRKPLLEFELYARNMALEVINGRPELFEPWLPELILKRTAAMAAMREEIKV